MVYGVSHYPAVFKYPNCDCFYNNIIHFISIMMQRDCRIVSLGGLYFNYSKLEKGSVIAQNGFDIHNHDYMFKALECICGIQILFEQVSDRTISIQKVLCELRDGNPVGIRIDSYWIPWNAYYMKAHKNHCLALVGYSENDNMLYCWDGFLSEQMQQIDIKELAGRAEAVMYFKSGRQDNKKQKVRQMVNYGLNAGESQRKLILFAKDLAVQEIEAEDWLQYSDINLCPFFMQMLNALWQRRYFMEGIDYLNELFGAAVFRGVIEKVKESIVIWERSCNLLMKNYIVRFDKNALQKVADNMMKAALIEYQIVGKLNDILNVAERK